MGKKSGFMGKKSGFMGNKIRQQQLVAARERRKLLCNSRRGAMVACKP